MIILLRGHIRNSFDNNKLYEILSILSKLYDIEIYIHTWNIVQSNVSWRSLDVINTPVTKEFIYDYFKDLSKFIKHIIIDNDKHIKLIGHTDGLIIKAPLVGWKNMWFGIHRIIRYIKNTHQRTDDKLSNFIVNMRFDLFCNSNVFAYDNVIQYIYNIANYKRNTSNELTRNIFMKNVPSCYGIDNIYIGNIYTIFKLAYHFHHHLDHILNVYMYNQRIKGQEALVVLENRRIFSNQNNHHGFFHPKHKKKFIPSVYGKNTGIGMRYRQPRIIHIHTPSQSSSSIMPFM